MAAESNTTPDPTVIEKKRYRFRDMPPAPSSVDKSRVLEHLRAQLAELQCEEAADGNA